MKSASGALSPRFLTVQPARSISMSSMFLISIHWSFPVDSLPPQLISLMTAMGSNSTSLPIFSVVSELLAGSLYSTVMLSPGCASKVSLLSVNDMALLTTTGPKKKPVSAAGEPVTGLTSFSMMVSESPPKTEMITGTVSPFPGSFAGLSSSLTPINRVSPGTTSVVGAYCPPPSSSSRVSVAVTGAPAVTTINVSLNSCGSPSALAASLYSTSTVSPMVRLRVPFPGVTLPSSVPILPVNRPLPLWSLVRVTTSRSPPSFSTVTPIEASSIRSRSSTLM